jgi:cytochrome oxidase Cu insertion factor (SCO1/SenC/PrrC family)/cytochrome c2
MQRRLMSTTCLSAIAAIALVTVSTAVAVLLPRAGSQPLSPRSASAAIAAAPATSQSGPRDDEGQKKPSHRNKWGANYFPNLPVIDQNGRTLKFYDDVIKGKTVIISFIYTSCQDACPLTTARLVQLADKLEKTGAVVGRDLIFVSMSVDPNNDTPERLKAFADAFDIGPGWLFLTGKEGDIRTINKRLGDRSDRGLSDHRNEILLGNDMIGDWQRDSAFSDVDKLVITVRQMNPKWLNEVHNLSPSSAPAKPVVLKLPDQPGQILFTRICAPCHSIGQGDRVGPDLRDVTVRRDREWLTRFIKNPKTMFEENDPTTLALTARFPGVRMPILGIGDEDAKELIAYLETASARIPEGTPPNPPQAGRRNN